MSAEQARVTPGDEATPEDRRMAMRFTNWCTSFQKAHPSILYFNDLDHVRLAWALFHLHLWSKGGLAVRWVDREPVFPWAIFEKVLGCGPEVVMEIEIDIDDNLTGHVCRQHGIPYVLVDSLPAVVPLLPDYLMSAEGKRRLQTLTFVWSQTFGGIMEAHMERPAR